MSAEKNANRFDAALDYLRSFTDYEQLRVDAPSRETFDLSRMHRLLDRLGHPERDVPAIHVTGTKGKSSTTIIAAEILRAHGLRTFRFLSPHLESVRERLTLDGTPVPPETFADLVETLRPVVEDLRERAPADVPSFFEAITAMGFVLARDAEADASVIEVGLGGRLDATNVLDPVAALITSIARDHTRILGEELESIAREKAGIVKRDRPVFVGFGPDHPAHAVVRDQAARVGAPFSAPPEGHAVERAEVRQQADGGPAVVMDLRLGDLRFRGLELRGGPPHQAMNALLAIAGVRELLSARGLALDAETVARALAHTRVPARAEWFPGRPPVLLDGAHTEESIERIVALVHDLAAGRPVHALCGLTRDRDPKTLLAPLVALADSVVGTRLPGPRAHPPAALDPGGGARFRAIEDPIAALHAVLDAATPDGVVCVVGSLYLAGAVRSALAGRAASAPEALDPPAGRG